VTNAATTPTVIFGLGNPGPKHVADRHNAGFWFVNRLAENHGGRFHEEARFSGSVCSLNLAGKPVRLVKPATFMNRSGQCVRRLLDYFQIAITDVLVVHDEIDLPPGSARLKFGGGHGGHNGLRDIIATCGADFRRLRIGVGHPGHKDAVVDYVLHAPGRDEQALIEEALVESLKALDTWFAQDLQRAVTYLHTATPRDAGMGPAG
jgi:PTH1 family peptidyl-tRNA hydrolase